MFFSIGLPSGFTQWCDVVIGRLVQDAIGPVAMINVNSLDELARAAIRMDATQAVVFSRHPTRSLLAAIVEAQRNFIVAVEEPRLVLFDLSGQGVEFLDATRYLAKSCASMVSVAAAPGALVLRPDRDGADPMAMAEAIAKHLQLDIASDRIGEVVGSVGPFEASGRRSAAAGWWDSLQEAMRVAATGALEPFSSHLAGAPLGTITWERELFFLYEETGEETPPKVYPIASRPVDITGRARHLVFGPYLALPAGDWTATVALGFSETAAEMSYVVDVCAGASLAQLRVEPHGRRFVEVTLDFSIGETLDALIEVRVASERPAFDGRLALGHVTLVPHGHIRSQTREYFSAALSE
jgi:hypothetical protein